MIAFDLDGTLVDSAPEIMAALDHAWRSVLGVALPSERVRIGPPLLEMIAALGPTLGEAQRHALAAAFRARYDASDFSATRPYPGVSEALATLARRGATLAIATNKRRQPTLGVLACWFPDRFARVACVDGVTPDDGTTPGTKTAMLRWLAREGEALVMVGDSASDIKAARAVGARAVAVAWGYEAASALAAAGPDDLVRDASALVRVLGDAA